MGLELRGLGVDRKEGVQGRGHSFENATIDISDGIVLGCKDGTAGKGVGVKKTVLEVGKDIGNEGIDAVVACVIQRIPVDTTIRIGRLLADAKQAIGEGGYPSAVVGGQTRTVEAHVLGETQGDDAMPERGALQSGTDGLTASSTLDDGQSLPEITAKKDRYAAKVFLAAGVVEIAQILQGARESLDGMPVYHGSLVP
jgi:hypothetical protein